jgi:Fumarylacetoacetate (FAA) hydrolase family
MFHLVDRPLERGWVGRINGEHVTHLAAQTLQSFFTGGGAAREHAIYPLAAVQLLAPVLHPPAVRIFEDARSFAFANPAATCGPDATVARPPSDTVSQGVLALFARVAGVIGADGEIAGYTLFAEWRDPRLEPPKDRDFSLGLGPVVVSPDELDLDRLAAAVRVDGEERLRGRFEGFDWSAARGLAAARTRLYPGDVLAGPPLAPVDVEPGSTIEIVAPDIGALTQSLSRD